MQGLLGENELGGSFIIRELGSWLVNSIGIENPQFQIQHPNKLLLEGLSLHGTEGVKYASSLNQGQDTHL